MPRQIPDPPASPPDQDLDPEVSLPGFSPVPQWPGPQAPDPATSPAPGTGGQDGGGDSGPGSSGGPDRPIPTGRWLTTRAKPYEAIARGLLRAAGGLLNMKLAGDDDDKSWIPDDEDEQAIPPPLGRLAARRVPIGDGQNLSELEDIGMAAVGLLAWAAKATVSLWDAHRARRRQKAPLQASGATIYQPEEGQPA